MQFCRPKSRQNPLKKNRTCVSSAPGLTTEQWLQRCLLSRNLGVSEHRDQHELLFAFRCGVPSQPLQKGYPPKTTPPVATPRRPPSRTHPSASPASGPAWCAFWTLPAKCIRPAESDSGCQRAPEIPRGGFEHRPSGQLKVSIRSDAR